MRKRVISIPDDSSWDVVDAERSQQLLAQLRREIGPPHELFGRLDDAEVIAADTATDDILLCIKVPKDALFVAHPTWSQVRSDSPHWPRAMEVQDHELAVVFANEI